MNTPKEWRKVAYIYPESFWGMSMNTTDEELNVASVEDSGHKRLRFQIRLVGPPRDEPEGRMIYYLNRPLQKESGTHEEWLQFQEDLLHALSLPPLFREDFTYI